MFFQNLEGWNKIHLNKNRTVNVTFTLRRGADTQAFTLSWQQHSALLQREYCITLWGHTTSTRQLLKLQTRTLRILAVIGYQGDCSSLKILILSELQIHFMNTYNTKGSFFKA